MKPLVVRLSDSVEIWHADCRDVLPVECDAVVTDPPYFRVKGEEWDRQWDNAAAFLEFIGERVTAWHRDLRPNGSLYCFASPKMAARVECKIGERFNVLNRIRWVKEAGWHNVLNTITWAKPPYSTKAEMFDKPTMRAFFPASERIIFAEHYGADNMAKGEAGYQAKCDELRGFVFEPLRAYLESEVTRAGLSKRWLKDKWMAETNTKSELPRHWIEQAQFELPTAERYEWLRGHCNRNGGEYLRREYEDLRREYEYLRREYEDLRRPFAVTAAVPYTDVWTFPTVQAYEGKHPCEKPLAMLEHIITASTRHGATVRDDFMGGGSTGIACIRTGRKFVGIEKDARYFEIARKRLENELRQGLLPLTYDNKPTVEP
jgi:site-specific DNA-methyltransferase (adenine-specific)